MQKRFSIGLLCGGPSLERGISLNSARSVMDNLENETIDIIPIYFNHKKQAFKISRAQLYSNTPSDFDFKLESLAKPLSQPALVRLLKQTDIVFPAMHGTFGEDGEIQSFLEKHSIPFVGSSAKACKLVFDKFRAHQFLQSQGFYTKPTALLKIYHNDHQEVIDHFFAENKIKRAVVKPAVGGSSIGVFSVGTAEEALRKAELIFSKRMDTRVVVEPFAKGVEFTVIVLENRFGQPVAILPTEIEADYTQHQIFDYRKKYLPTRHVTYHCPPRFSKEIIEKIQVQAEQIFAAAKMSDFARFDGWVLDDDTVWFSDLNPISGMEQHSFLFQQASRIGLSHTGVLRHIIGNACKRYNIDWPEVGMNNYDKQEVSILFGGKTSERQVSLLSGTNVWLKLQRSQKYLPVPYLLDTTNLVWKLPYALVLNHTVEEIAKNCRSFRDGEERLNYLESKASLRLALRPDQIEAKLFPPEQISLEQFISQSPLVFNALHGGEGEDGSIQQLFEKQSVAFNGPGSKTSRLCADKWKTVRHVRNLKIDGLRTASSQIHETNKLLAMTENQLKLLWKNLVGSFKSESIIVKPTADGCSSGIIRLFSADDLIKYLGYIRIGASAIPRETFKNQFEATEMPVEQAKSLLFEEYIATDLVSVKQGRLHYQRKSGWVEVTIGLIEIEGKIRVFNPSLTLATGEVLTVEEKFQGGTGINITPPPREIIRTKSLNRAKNLIGQLANKFNLTGYSRIDAFLNLDFGDLIVIEVNTLPALTPSTVLFHQALAEEPPIFPRDLLELIIGNALITN